MRSDNINDIVGITIADPIELVQLARIAKRLPSWVKSIRANKGGQYLSLSRGRGMEYDESRVYQAGDDIRYLDSRTTARRGEAFTKVFREERERPVYICVDDRASMHFGTRTRYKRTVAANTAAIIAWKAFFQGERIAGFIFNEQQQIIIKSARGRRAVMKFVKELGRSSRRASISNQELSNSLSVALSKLRKYITPGSLVFFISDFQGLNSNHITEFTQLRSRCDFVLAQVSDHLESSLPKTKGLYRMINARAQVSVLGDNNKMQAELDEIANLQKENIESLVSSMRSPILNLTTDCEPADELRKLFRY